MIPGTNPPQTGAALIGAAGDYWNNYAVAALSNQALKDSGGNGTGATLTFTSEGAYSANPAHTRFTGQPAENLMGGYLWSYDSQTSVRATISGLSAGHAYELYVYTQGDDGSWGRQISFNVNGEVQTSAQTNADTFVLNNNYLIFHVLADSSGVIDIAQVAMVGEGNLNGFQLLAAPVPEPSSGLMLLGGLGLLAAHLRRSRTASGSARNKSCADASCPSAP
ncbi:PEP-CTERM sorting domain-containing protein [Duganella radicis]|uniref:PEP-CTERM sorting domain-containing protein n=1 Tax=Duganella radicis TaxID=551988 RepID=A0A6L6PEX0_9BURK|nr:PEP-CTERM sorting domain-containing protein [Duganella radicis]